MNQSLTIRLAGLSLRNPVMLAAGTCGYLDELSDVMDLSRIGAVVTKSITALPRDGNRTWRILPSRAGLGMLNAIGLANIGADAFEREYASRIAGAPTTVVGSISEFSIDGYVRVASMMSGIAAMPAVELNVSCPNVKHGTEFGLEAELLRDLVGAVREVLPRTRLFVKLSPAVMGVPGGVVAMCRAAIEARGRNGGPNACPGADAVCIANTAPALAIDVRTRRPLLARGSGGLSGPSVHPIAVKLVHDAYNGICKQTQTPIIGIGGVLTWEDAAEFVLAGATAVEMGTALFADPKAPAKVIRGLEKWVETQKCVSIADLVGAMIPPNPDAA